MRKYVLPLIVVLSLIGAMAYADIQGHTIKWSQMPNMVAPATDWSSTNNFQINSMVADDWLCNSTGTIDDVHWWGSLMLNSSTGGPSLTQPDDFQITIYQYTHPEGGFSEPGTTLWQQAFDVGAGLGEVNVNYYGTTGAEAVYQYYVDMTALAENMRFRQTSDTFYFMSIQALHTELVGQAGYGDVWGWHEAVTHNYDDAVWRLATQAPWTPAERDQQSLDMAFELSQVPEPGTLALLALGLPGLFWWRRRRG